MRPLGLSSGLYSCDVVLNGRDGLYFRALERLRRRHTALGIWDVAWLQSLRLTEAGSVA
jgi:hypothetical protein